MNHDKWLTIKEAALLAHEMGLDRTNKTFRSWARRSHVTATKKDTANSEMWLLDHDELVKKVKTEMEFEKQKSTIQTGSNLSEPVQTRSNHSEPVRTSANSNEPNSYETIYQQRPNRSEPTKTNDTRNPRIRELENEILILRTDLKWRNEVIANQKEDNKILLDEIKGQSQFIGHLKTKLFKLGESADQSFLEAPVPKSGLSADADNQVEVINPEIVQNDQVHPNQRDLYSG